MLYVFNDTHCGVLRSAGTTPRTQWELRQWNLDMLASLLECARGKDVMFLGDLFDTFAVPLNDLYRVFTELDDWLTRNPEQNLWLVAGNHDLSKTSTTMSSFHLLASLLQGGHPNVQAILKPTMTPYGYVVPHLPNQELFDEALRAVPECEALFLHCNYDNNFAAQSDQSLNLTAEQAGTLPVKHIVIAHEHQTRIIGQRVFIPGNQIPTSVADWLGTDCKRFLTISAPGDIPVMQEWITADGVFARVDWRTPELVRAKFIRLEGTATAEEAQEVLEAVSQYRTQSDAFVVTNAVRVQSAEALGSFAESLETIRAFDVLAALEGLLAPEEFKLVKEALQK